MEANLQSCNAFLTHREGYRKIISRNNFDDKFGKKSFICMLCLLKF